MGRIIETQLKLPKWIELAIILASCAQAQAALQWPLRGITRAAAQKASSLAQPPAGFVYQPLDPNYYQQVAEQTRERFRVNATFFQTINSTKVPKILHVTNGTFDVLPVSLNATPRAEDALDGYDYNSLLGMSWLFYEAQRSGKLPPHNRIPWRGDSALDDVAPNRISSVSGGWLGWQHEGRYSDSVPAASKMYPSSYYEDDLAWGASWLYRKTGDKHFLQDAQAWYERHRARQGGGGYLGYGWDSSIWGVSVQLASLTSNSAPVWAAEVQLFLDAWIHGYRDVVRYTPLGLAWANEWGSLRFTANAALIAVVYAKHIKGSDPGQAQKYECWARSQIR